MLNAIKSSLYVFHGISLYPVRHSMLRFRRTVQLFLIAAIPFAILHENQLNLEICYGTYAKCITSVLLFLLKTDCKPKRTEYETQKMGCPYPLFLFCYSVSRICPDQKDK